MRMYGLELGKVVALYDQRALRSLNAAQRNAQEAARKRLQHHARRTMALAEAAPYLDPQARAALEAVADLMDLMCRHMLDEDEPTSTLPGPRTRRHIGAPAQLWAPQSAEPEPVTASVAPPKRAFEPDWNGPVVCRHCGLRLERTEQAGTLNRPFNQGWRHLDSRKTHFPDPVPVASTTTS